MLLVVGRGSDHEKILECGFYHVIYGCLKLIESMGGSVLTRSSAAQVVFIRDFYIAWNS